MFFFNDRGTTEIYTLPRHAARPVVPGGVGPMTIAMLLSKVVEAAERRVGLSEPLPGGPGPSNPA